MPDAYLCAEPLPEPLLHRFGLVQLNCVDGGTLYQNAVVFRPQRAVSETASAFLHWLLPR